MVDKEFLWRAIEKYSVLAGTLVVALAVATPHLRIVHLVTESPNFVTAHMSLMTAYEDDIFIKGSAISCNKTLVECGVRSTIHSSCKITSGMMHMAKSGPTPSKKKYSDYHGENGEGMVKCHAVKAMNWLMPLFAAIGLFLIALQGHPSWLPESERGGCCSPLGWTLTACACYLFVFAMTFANLVILTDKDTMNDIFTDAANEYGHGGGANLNKFYEAQLAMSFTILLSASLVVISVVAIFVGSGASVGGDVSYAMVQH